METWNLLIDSNRGVYIPVEFVRDYYNNLPKTEAVQANVEIIKQGPDHVEFWEAWEDLLECELTDKFGNKFTLHHDSDLWAVPVGFDWDSLEC